MRARIVVFARYPEVGRVKSRLAPVVGVAAAAHVYRALLEHTLRQAVASGLPTTLALAEPPPTPAVWLPPDGVALEVQEPGELGSRMAQAFAAQFSSGADAVVLVGSDIPLLSTALLLEAAARCMRAPVVLGPTADGGYYLVAQVAPGVDMFEGVPWSTSRTLACTRARLAALGLPHEELPLLLDLDTGDDLDAALADPALDPRLRREIQRVLGGKSPGEGEV